MSINPPGIRILVISNDPLARAGLTSLLSVDEHIIVTGSIHADIRVAIDLSLYKPDVVLWDIGWDAVDTELSSLTALIREVTQTGLSIIALLPREDLASALWSAGARGLIMRDAATEQISAAIIGVASGLCIVAPPIADILIFSSESLEKPPEEGLTPRELEVLKLIAEGHSNRAIAHQLNISEHTIKFHVNSIMTKLHAQSRTEAVVRATRLGLISL